MNPERTDNPGSRGDAPSTGMQRVFIGAGIALLAGLFLAVSLTPVTNNDIWLHMANGRWILDNGQVPLTDPYSFSAEGHRFYAHEWLAGVFFHLVYLAGGVTGLIFFKTFLGALALAGCTALARRAGAGWSSTLACTGVALVIVNPRFLERPEMFSYALTALYVWAAMVEHERLSAARLPFRLQALRAPGRFFGASRLWWLVPVQWLWVQLHGYFLTGIALIGMFLVGEWLARLLDVARPTAPAREAVPRSRRARKGTPVGRTRPARPSLSTVIRKAPTLGLVSGSVAGLMLIFVGLLNPNGLEIYTFPFELADSVFTETIFEWRPTFVTPSILRSSMLLAFCAWLGMLVVGCLDSRRLLARPGLWRGVAVTGLLMLLLIRVNLPGPPRDGAAPASAWLWSPGELLLALSGGTPIGGIVDGILSPLRLLGGFGDDMFTLLWLGLAGLAVYVWRRPWLAGVPILGVTVAFVLVDAQPSLGRGISDLLARLAPGNGPLTDLRQVGAAAVTLLVMFVAPALFVALRRGSWPLWQTLVTLLFLYMAVKQNRNMVNFALVTLPFVAASLSRVRRALPEPEHRDARHGSWRGVAAPLAFSLCAGGLLLLTLGIGWPYSSGVVKKPGFGIGKRVPVGAVEYIRSRGIGGRSFNKYAYGAFLVHQLFPSTRVFMDSRNDVYGPELYETYLDALAKEHVATRVFSEYEFDYVLVDYRFYPGRSPDAGLFAYLRKHPEWVLVYFDDTSVLYLREDGPHADVVANDAYRLIDPASYVPGGSDETRTGNLPEWERESLQAVRRQPGSVSARLIRIDYLMATQRPTEAREMIESVLDDDSNNLVALIGGARVARQQGDRARSAALYRRALQIRPDLQPLRQELEALGETAP